MDEGKKALLISCFDWYQDRLKYIEEYLETVGYSVKILISDFNHIEKSYSDKYKSLKQIQYVHVPQYKRNISVKRLMSHKYFALEVVSIIKKERPALIYCLIPPNSLAKEIAGIKSVIGFKLIFDVIDLWPESFPWGNASLYPFVQWRKLREDSLTTAEKIVLECKYYAKVFKNIEADKLEVVRLIMKPLEEVTEYEPFTEDICLGYLGSINSLIDIDKICEVVKEMKKTGTVCVRIVGEGEQRKKFLQSLENLGVSVRYYGKLFDEKKLQYILGNCHFGINIYKTNVKIGLTIKSVDYFRMGIPILSTIAGDTESLIEQYKAGINLNKIDISCIGKIMEQFVKEPDVGRANARRLFDEMFSSIRVWERLEFLKQL